MLIELLRFTSPRLAGTGGNTNPPTERAITSASPMLTVVPAFASARAATFRSTELDVSFPSTTVTARVPIAFTREAGTTAVI